MKTVKRELGTSGARSTVVWETRRQGWGADTCVRSHKGSWLLSKQAAHWTPPQESQESRVLSLNESIKELEKGWGGAGGGRGVQGGEHMYTTYIQVNVRQNQCNVVKWN